MKREATSPTQSLLRGLSLLLRSLHLAALVGLGAVLLGADLDHTTQAMGVLLSGAGLLLVEWWSRPQLFLEGSGLALGFKLLAVAWLSLQPDLQLSLFWAILVWSVLFAHAPRTLRHRRWWHFQQKNR